MDHGGDTVDVDSASSYVGCDQGLNIALGEAGEGPRPLALAPTAVDGRSLDAGPTQLFCQPVRAVAGSTENDCRPHCIHCIGSYGDPVGLLVNLPEQVACGGDVGRFLADLVADGIGLILLGQLFDVTIECGGEENGLPVAALSGRAVCELRA